MKEVIVVDIDGTLLERGVHPRLNVVKLILDRQETYDIIVVTSRTYSQRYITESALRKLRIKPVTVVYGIGKDNPWAKAAVVRKIQTKTRVALALDNNPAVLLEYQELGIETLHPDDA